MTNQSFALTILKWLKVNRAILVALLIFPLPYLLSDIIIFNYRDMYPYLKIVKDFQDGHWRVFLFHGGHTNFYALVLFIDFMIFGTKLIAIKYLFVLTIGLIQVECWILGKILFKNNSGVITAILVGTSYTFIHFLYFPHYDLLLLAMLVMCMIIMSYGMIYRNSSFFWMFFSGLAIGLSFLMKEAAIWLVLVVPIFSMFTRVKIKNILIRWCYQLLPLIVLAAPIIISDPGPYYRRYIRGLIYWLSILISGDPSVLLNHNLGANISASDVSFLNVFTFAINPVFWQWESIVPIPNYLVWSEQIIIVSVGVYFFLSSSSDKKAKYFLLTVLIVYLPRYIVISVTGFKIRQILIVFFVLYPILGNALYNLVIRLKSALLAYTNKRRIHSAIVIFIFTFYLIRTLLCNEGILFTIGSTTEFNNPFQYRHPIVVPWAPSQSGANGTDSDNIDE